MSDDLDPVTYQVVRNRMLAITDEMRIALQSVSGSPTVTQASDFFTGLFRPDGTFISMGYQGTITAPALSDNVRWIIANAEITVNPGDVFISNDPFVGALHQNDVQMIAPIFEGERLLGWAAVMAHETDVGGMDFASWSPKARDIYQEGLLMPSVKLVDRGEFRHDVLRMILAASRLPQALGLDIRAFVATLTVAGRRFLEVAAHYGEDVVSAVMDRMLEQTERRLRARIAELPDGVYRNHDFLEHDGHEDRLYKIDVVITKRADSMVLDFSGTSPQAPGFINCTRPGLLGAVAGSILPTLAYDMSWNEGAMRPLDVVAPDGLLVTAQHPAPVGAATVQAIWLTCAVVFRALNKMLAASPAYASRAQGVNCGSMATFNMGGRNRHGEWFGFHMLDSQACGGGAYATKDGINAGGPYIGGPMPAISDVERNELVTPMRFLYRRMARDSSGHGRKRGGASIEIAITLGGVESVEALLLTYGQEVPNGHGLGGSLPGSQIRQRIGRGVFAAQGFETIAPEEDVDTLGGDWEEFGPKPGLVPMMAADVIALSWQGGGGIGDPLEREPAAVLVDFAGELISEVVTNDIYGVVVVNGEVDDAATGVLRDEIRDKRLGPDKVDIQPVLPDAELSPFCDVLELAHDANGWHVVCKGHVIVSGTTEWRPHALRRQIAMPPGNPALHPGAELTAYYCPATGTQLAVDLHEKGAPPEDDVELDLEVLSSYLQCANAGSVRS